MLNDSLKNKESRVSHIGKFQKVFENYYSST